MSMFNDISFGTKDNEHECNSYLCTQGDLEKDNGHSLVLVPKRSERGQSTRNLGQSSGKDVG